jgi:hypothetical protein
LPANASGDDGRGDGQPHADSWARAHPPPVLPFHLDTSATLIPISTPDPIMG